MFGDGCNIRRAESGSGIRDSSEVILSQIIFLNL
jgi:hypothetical protein